MFCLAIILLILGLCIYACVATGNSTILFAGILTGAIITGAGNVISLLLDEKFDLTSKGSNFISWDWTWGWIILVTVLYAVPLGIVTSILLTTANVIWGLNFLQSVGLVIGFSLIIGLLLWLMPDDMKGNLSFFIGAILVTTIINSAAISLVCDWLRQPMK